MTSPFARIAAVLPLLALSAAAQDKYGGELFELPGSASSIAMGGASVSSLRGPATGFFNPALVGLPQQAGLLLSHREQFGGVVNADLIAATLPVRGNLALQLGLVRRGVDRIPDTRNALIDLNGNGLLDDDEILVGSDVTYFNQREWGLLLSVASRNQEGWQWGLNAKLLGHWLADELGLGVGFDLGVYRAFSRGIRVGAMLQDVTTTQIHWSTGRWATVMPRITAGFTWTFGLPLFGNAVSLAAEATSRLDGERLERDLQLGPVSLLTRMGVELALNESLHLRGGRSTLYPLSIGAGLDFPAFTVDYAYVGDTAENVFEPTHQLALTLNLKALRTLLGSD
ncbi:MAG: hypothetical protein IIA59_09925 [Candidatus Marinimicrobia bacterium]|nr:hypothetical protein [Candidatus Neomarinimicrobiota bacterium]